MCGASKEEKAAQKQEAAISKKMMEDAAVVFKQNQNILSSITSAMSPIAQSPFEFGFDKAEETAMRTEAQDTAARAGQNAEVAAMNQEASRSGGAFIPSGADKQINAMINAEAGFRNASAQRDITQQGYEAGRENFFKANTVLATAPGMLQNPATSANTGAANSTSQSYDQAKSIREANHAWLGALGGLAGGIIGGPIGGAIGSKLLGGKKDG